MKFSKWIDLGAIKRIYLFILLSIGFFHVEIIAETAPSHSITMDEITVSGMGWKNNRKLKKSLTLVMKDDSASAEYGTAFLEDSLWVLEDALRNEGHLKPSFFTTIELANGTRTTLEWTKENGFSTPPPKPDNGIKQIEFLIDPGVLYHYESITIQGLDALPSLDHDAFFFPSDQWLSTRKNRIFTPKRFQGSLQQLVTALREKGFRDAQVAERKHTMDETTGAVTATVAIETGLPFYLGNISVKIDTEAGEETEIQLPDETLKPLPQYPRIFTPSWLSDQMLTIRREIRQQGYPNVKTAANFTATRENETHKEIDLQITVSPGPQKRIGNVRISGDKHILQSLIDKRVDLESGQLFDTERIEESQAQLSRLKAFKAINIDYQDIDIHTRDVSIELEPLPKDTVRLIAGVGSYDIVRGGIIWDRNHLWQRAHRSELEVLQSLRMTHVEFGYHIPLFLNQNVDFFAKTEWLSREEVSFDQSELGTSVGITYPWQRFNTLITVQYNYQSLSTSKEEFQSTLTNGNATIGSIELNARKSELDNPINPTEGYQIFANLEFANPMFGGEVNYQRATFGGAWHQSYSGGFVSRVGFQHGFVRSGEDSSENIPVNRRFFLGGENTVRGYQQGQASPVDDSNQEIGGEFFTLLQVELEQKLNQTYSVVLFSDSVGIGENLDEYGSPEWLFTVGIGLRVRTFLGPLRVEYGYNLNPRPFDPKGHIQIGLGLPF